MKRKLPQWLLDATNDNKSGKIHSSPSKLLIRTCNDNNNVACNNENIEPNPRTESKQIQSTETINVVPIQNLLSASRCVPESTSNRTTHASNINIINDEIPLQRSATNLEDLTNQLQPVIKTEMIDEVEPSISNINGTVANNQPQAEIKKEIKEEPTDTASNIASNPASNPLPIDQTIKPERATCQYGIKCFRQNAGHRTELAHPGDMDYRRPSFPNPPPNTPVCPWGAACYRRNPQHFIQLSHPPATNTATVNANTNGNAMQQQNILSTRRNRRSNRPVVNNFESDDDDYDLEDPFIDDGSSDEYIPDEDELDETETPADDLEEEI